MVTVILMNCAEVADAELGVLEIEDGMNFLAEEACPAVGPQY